MIRKGLISKDEDGRYYPLVTKQEVAFSRIDRSRVRLQQPDRAMSKRRERLKASTFEKTLYEPYAARLAFNKAKKIALRYGSLVAAYFLVHSLIGARETGFLLFWLNNWFVFCEPKTGFCHHFYSALLDRYFQLLSLKQGIQYMRVQEH